MNSTNINNILSKLYNLGIKISVVEDRLKIQTTKEDIPSDILEEIKLNKYELIDYLEGKGKKNEFVKIENAEIKDNYLLSSAQKRLYLLQQMDLESTVYNMPLIIPFGAKVDDEKIKKIFNKLVNRHESFRTSFKLLGEVPIQCIQKKIDLKIEKLTIEKSEELQTKNKFIQAFNLSKAPLLRVAIVEIKGAESLLMIDMHHIISDGISHGILEREFLKLFSGDELDPLRLQYKDYSEWLNKYKQKVKVKEQEDYWLGKFKGEIPILNLSTDYTRPAMHSHDGAKVKFALNKVESDNIKSLANENDLTLYMAVLSVFTILLSKLSGQEDIIVGTPIAGRNHSDLENIVGMFVNTLTLRNEIKGNESLKDFTANLRYNCLNAFANPNYQFEDLVEKLSLERDISRNPLFDVMFNFLNQREYNGLISENDNLIHITGTSKFDLNLTAIEFEDNILFNLEYSTRLFKEETINKIINYFRNIANQVNGKTEMKISEIDILSEEERQKLLFSFNDTKSNYAKEKTIHELFEEQVEINSEATALIFNGVKLTYTQLNEKANRLAWKLREQGVKKDTIVGLIVERSIELVVAVMGILKAGAAYLPIDAELPQDRINIMLEDSELHIVLVNNEISNLNFETERYLIYDLRNESSYSLNTANLDIINVPDDLIYLIYTSGSTGKPKGVMLEHKNMVNLINFNYEKTNIDFSSVLQFVTISFDVSALEIFGSLLSGGKLLLVDELTRLNVSELFSLMLANEVKTVFWPMSFIKMIFAEESYIKQLPKCLRHIQTAGEQVVISKNLSEYLKTNNVFLHNHYGPSETHVVTTLTLTPEGSYQEFPSIGKPISNTSIYILDQYFKLVPIGVVGELCIGGDQVGRGYLGREELTSEKFIENPFTKGKKIYCTGDLARWLPDGNIEFLGRIDHQVKIRGFRIELGEIESVLHKHKNIKECIVLDREDKGDKYLCAYVVCEEENSSEDLRTYLNGLLPDYMIPSYFVEMDEFPLNNSGKINRKLLPSPEVKASDDYIAPSTEVEEKLVEIWSELLNIPIEEIGVTVNFFTIGGHSLKATVLAGKIHKEIEIEFPFREVFIHPTIQAQARYIETKKWLSNNQKNSVNKEKTEVSI